MACIFETTSLPQPDTEMATSALLLAILTGRSNLCIVGIFGAGVRSLRPTLHGLRLIIKEDVLPQIRSRSRGCQAWPPRARNMALQSPVYQPETTMDVPLLGTVIEKNGDGCLEDSLMPVGWPLHLDGAVKQRCIHRTTTLRELDELLQAYDMKRNLVELVKVW